MPDDPVRRRSRRAAKRIERQRRKALAARTRKAETLRPPAQNPREQRVPDSQTCRLRAGQMILRAGPA